MEEVRKFALSLFGQHHPRIKEKEISENMGMVNLFEDQQAQWRGVREGHTVSVVMVGEIDQVGRVL